MRIITTIALIGILPCASAKEPVDAKSTVEEQMQIHSKGSIKLADEQDELSADIQQLVIEQTIPPVIELLGQVEEIMDETTDYLLEGKTGGETIAAQTEIIEKIHAAAKKRQNEGEGGGSGSAMMDMMERMMGKRPGNQQGQGKKDDKPGDQAGQGSTGESDTTNEAQAGDNAGKVEARTVPKASGTAGRAMPDEFRKALDAYNRGVERMIK